MQKRRPHLILLALITAILAVVALLGIPGSPIHKKATLGLDLQGGFEVILKAQPPKGVQVTSDGLNRSVDIIRDRTNKLGTGRVMDT